VSTGTVAGIGGAAAGAAIAAATLGGGDEPTPLPLTIAVSPSGAGVRDVTEFAFSVEPGDASTTDSWQFGDGATTTGSSVRHVYRTEGTFQVGLKRSSASTSEASVTVTVGSLTGSWHRAPVDGVTNRLILTQEGSTLSGQWIVEIAPFTPLNPGAATVVSTVPLRGTVRSPRTLTLEQLGECLRTIPSGSVGADLSTIGGPGFYANPACGDGTGSLTGGWTFVRQ
jgi:hypothetical protein